MQEQDLTGLKVLLLFSVLVYKVDCSVLYMFKFDNPYKRISVFKSMKYKTINTKQFNNLLNINEVNKNKGIKLIKSKLRFYVGCGIFAIAILTPMTNWFLIPLSMAICGLSFFDLKNLYIPELKRKAKNKIRGLL